MPVCAECLCALNACVPVLSMRSRHALYADLVEGRPWPESNATICQARLEACLRAKAALSHLVWAIEHRAGGAAAP